MRGLCVICVPLSAYLHACTIGFQDDTLSYKDMISCRHPLGKDLSDLQYRQNGISCHSSKEVREAKSVSVPVYAIRGIECNNVRSVCKAGAKGACIMSGFMTCDDAKSFRMSFEEVDDS